ncbi:AMP-binding protein [Acetobacter sacchari]|uniref:AMP-binding protein n=1 Tax=Acetobacter sacchari TaxID=2661687 RepID=A0ABS3M0J1_9PROT|nr:AMP-binding protein [Acetobacter sacchari]MBO1361697.1 AMP-binding protein [Acetobacter sacchari]
MTNEINLEKGVPVAVEPVPGSLEFWAAERRDDIAIVDGDRRLSYGDWNDLADALADAMSDAGLGKGSVVVVRLQIRHEWAIVAAACAKLGCEILGLNWRLTPSEVGYILRNSHAQALICDDERPDALLSTPEEFPLRLRVSFDSSVGGFLAWNDLVSRHARPRFSKEEAPLIIYTSGTTGFPKGVKVGKVAPRSSITELREYMQSVTQVRARTADEIVLITLPMHHGAGPATVRAALATGSLMVFLRRFDPEAVLALIDRERVTSWTAVPTMYKRLASLPDDVIARYDVSSLKMLGIGAEPTTPELKQWIVDHFGPILWESYGSTETGMICALMPAQQAIRPQSSGLPHRHVTIEIRDPDGQSLPAGTDGEVWVRTPVTITNYVNAAALGQDTLDDRGFFRTGDIGRLDTEGYVFITGRAKDMIISGGVNIYPAEIEAAICKHPAVQDAAVVGIPDIEFGEQVKAVVELKPGASLEKAALLSFVSPLLASYKRPKTVDIVDALPRNTMGKLLKRELRDPYWVGRERQV